MKLFDVQWNGTVAAETAAEAESMVEDAIARNGWLVELDNCSADLADNSDPDSDGTLDENERRAVHPDEYED